MLRNKYLVSLAKFLHNKSLSFLKKNNSYSAYTIPKSSSNPRFILHSGADIKNGGIINIEPWLPCFIESGIEFVVVVRSFDVYEKLLLLYPEIHLSLVSSPQSLDNLLQKFKNVSGFFYVANTANNNLLLRRAEGRHIFLGHGDSDKSSSMNRFFRVYDEIYVAGQAHIDRFQSANFETSGMNFRIIGRPDSTELVKKLNFNKKENYKKIIYLPTWEGYCAEQNYSSLSIFHDICTTLSSNITLPIFAKLHPVTGAVNGKLLQFEAQSEVKTIDNLKFINREKKLTSILDNQSIYICDISASVTECLIFNNPIFLYTPNNKFTKMISGKIKYTDFTYTFTSADELLELMKLVLEGNDYLKVKREEAMNYFISIGETQNKTFKKSLMELSKQP